MISSNAVTLKMFFLQHEIEFNRIHKLERQHVERAFGLMKMKWRRLKFVDVFLMEIAHVIIMVAACLHNFGLTHDNWIHDEPPVQREPINEDNDENMYNSDEDVEDERRGFEKRRIMAEELY